MASLLWNGARHLIAAANRSTRVHEFAENLRHRMAYEDLKAHFIDNGGYHRVGRAERTALVARFEKIDDAVPMASTRPEGLLVAEMILNLDAPGAFVECGCFAGGSTAKLSILARMLNRELLVFDSFQGLPAGQSRDQDCRWGVVRWAPGAYSAHGQEAVGRTLERYGEPSVCRLVAGWFNETLHHQLSPEVAFAFVDVDLAASARTCLEAIWPRLATRGIFATHDTSFIDVLQTLYDPGLWRDHFKEIPPLLFGAGYGICDAASHLGYMVKGEALPSAYLKAITLRKEHA